MSNKPYIYNATDDKMDIWHLSFTSRFGDGNGDPEEQYLSCVDLVALSNPRARWLDIGCGLGRFIKIIQNKVDYIVGLEPDYERFTIAYNSYHDGKKIQIENTTSAEYKKNNPDARFNVILLSMVLQHVSTSTCNKLLNDIRDLLDQDGIAIISTTQFCEEKFTFQLDSKNHKIKEFDKYADNTNNQKYGIPVRKFSKSSFLDELKKAGFKVVQWGQFSYYKPDKLEWFAKEYKVLPQHIKDIGDSQYAIVKIG